MASLVQEVAGPASTCLDLFKEPAVLKSEWRDCRKRFGIVEVVRQSWVPFSLPIGLVSISSGIGDVVSVVGGGAVGLGRVLAVVPPSLFMRTIGGAGFDFP